MVFPKTEIFPKMQGKPHPRSRYVLALPRFNREENLAEARRQLRLPAGRCGMETRC
jgi:hypothetical protein